MAPDLAEHAPELAEELAKFSQDWSKRSRDWPASPDSIEVVNFWPMRRMCVPGPGPSWTMIASTTTMTATMATTTSLGTKMLAAMAILRTTTKATVRLEHLGDQRRRKVFIGGRSGAPLGAPRSAERGSLGLPRRNVRSSASQCIPLSRPPPTRARWVMAAEVKPKSSRSVLVTSCLGHRRSV